MTTPIPNCIRTSKNSEKTIPIEVDRVAIVDLASGTLLQGKTEPKPRKKITTILHRLPTPSPKAAISSDDASLFNDKAFESYLIENQLRYDPRSGLFSKEGKPLSSFESSMVMHQFRMGKFKEELRKPKQEQSLLKPFMDFKAHLASLGNKGWQISEDGGFAVNLRYDIVPLADLQDAFEVEQMKFRQFLEGKRVQYDAKADALTRKGEILPVTEALTLIKEFQNPKTSFTESVKSTLGLNAIHMPKKLRVMSPKSVEHLESGDGKVKLVLSGLLEFEGRLDYLRATGWTIFEDGSGKDPEGDKHSLEAIKDGFMEDKERFSSFLEKAKLHYDRVSGLLATSDRTLTADECAEKIKEHAQRQVQQKSLDLQETPKGRVELCLKAFTEFEYYLDYIQLDGWKIYRDGRAKDQKGNEVPAETVKTSFKALETNFKAFLERKNLRFAPLGCMLATRNGILSTHESMLQIAEFQGKGNQITVLPTGNVPRKGRELMPDSIKLRSSKDGGVKFSLKALLQYEYFLDHLQLKGMEIHDKAKQDFQDIQAKFKAFLDSKGMRYDSSSGLLASGDRVLNSSEIYNLIGEFESDRDDGSGSVKSKSRKKLAVSIESNDPISREEQKTKLILKAFYDFESYLEMLEKDHWTINREGKFAVDPKGQTVVFHGLEERFKRAGEYFRAYRAERGLHYDPNSGWITGKDFAETQALIKSGIQCIKIKTALHYLMEFEGTLDAQRINGWEVDMEKKISIDLEGKITTFAEAEEGFSSRKVAFLDYLDLHGFRFDEATKSLYIDKWEASMDELEQLVDNYAKEKEKKKKQLELILKSYTDFNYTLALLQNEGWKVNVAEEFALDPRGQIKSFATLQGRFRMTKENFLSFLEEKGLHYDKGSGWLASKDKVLGFEKSSALVNELNSKERVADGMRNNVVADGLRYIMELDGLIHALGKARWKINYDGKFVFGPNGEFFTFDELEEKKLNPTKKAFLAYLDDRGYQYDESKKSIYMGNTQAPLELAEQLVKHFLNPKEVKEPKINYQLFPDFEAVKQLTLETMEYKDYLKALENLGWKIEKETLISPEGKINSLQGLEYKYIQSKTTLIFAAGNNRSKLGEFLDSKKDQILKDVVKTASVQFGMKYNSDKKMFVSGERVMMVQEMVMNLTLKQLGLL